MSVVSKKARIEKKALQLTTLSKNIIHHCASFCSIEEVNRLACTCSFFHSICSMNISKTDVSGVSRYIEFLGWKGQASFSPLKTSMTSVCNYFTRLKKVVLYNADQDEQLNHIEFNSPQAIQTLLLRNKTTLEELIMNFQQRSVFYEFCFPALAECQVLHTLHIVFPTMATHMRFPPLNSTPQFFAPCVKKLTLKNYYFSSEKQTIAIYFQAFPNLTFLDLDNFTTYYNDSLQDLGLWCPKLKHLFLIPRESTVWPYSNLKMSSQGLSLETYQESLVRHDHWINGKRPHAQYYFIKTSEMFNGDISPSLDDPFTAVSETVTTLIIMGYGNRFPHTLIQTCMKLFPNIQTLFLQNCSPDYIFFIIFGTALQKPETWPRLKRIVLDQHDKHYFLLPHVKKIRLSRPELRFVLENTFSCGDQNCLDCLNLKPNDEDKRLTPLLELNI